MRLIDADEFIEYLGLNEENAREENLGEIVALEDFDRQETAFDLESVIEQLKELKTYKLNMADAMSELINKDKLGNYVCLEDVIKILKSVTNTINEENGG